MDLLPSLSFRLQLKVPSLLGIFSMDSTYLENAVDSTSAATRDSATWFVNDGRNQAGN